MAEVTPSPDALGLAELKKSGADLEKLHLFDFTLRFPSQQSAQRAELDLVSFAFEPTTERGRSDAEWIIHATKVMYPAENDLAGLREKLDAIARKGRGTYDGWTAKVFVRKPAG